MALNTAIAGRLAYALKDQDLANSMVSDINTLLGGGVGSTLTVGATVISEAEIGVLDSVTPGTAAVSKAVVLNSSGGIATIVSATITTLTTTNTDAGASGTAGSVDVFPTTASKGKLTFVAADSAGDTTTTVTNASQSGARTYTIPDAGASASFLMTAGSQTVSGAMTYTGGVTVSTVGLTITDVNVALGTSTGTQIGTATGQKLGFHAATPVIQRASSAQAAVVTTASTLTTPYGYATQAQADAIVALVNELRAALVEKGLIKGAS